MHSTLNNEEAKADRLLKCSGILNRETLVRLYSRKPPPFMHHPTIYVHVHTLMYYVGPTYQLAELYMNNNVRLRLYVFILFGGRGSIINNVASLKK